MSTEKLFGQAGGQLLRQWWHSLQPFDATDKKAWERRGSRFPTLGRRDRAELRRCTSPLDVLLQPAFIHLQRALVDLGMNEFERWPAAGALTAGLLARVNVIGGESTRPFACLLGMPRQAGGGPRFSKLRFGQLQAAATDEEFFVCVRRAIDLLDTEPIDVVELGSDLMHWADELRGEISPSPSDRIHVLWAKRYFTEAAAPAAKA